MLHTAFVLVAGVLAAGALPGPSPDRDPSRLQPGLFHLTGDTADVRQVLNGKDPQGALRVYSGYSGWTAGQLPAEIRAGVWVLDRLEARGGRPPGLLPGT